MAMPRSSKEMGFVTTSSEKALRKSLKSKRHKERTAATAAAAIAHLECTYKNTAPMPQQMMANHVNHLNGINPKHLVSWLPGITKTWHVWPGVLSTRVFKELIASAALFKVQRNGLLTRSPVVTIKSGRMSAAISQRLSQRLSREAASKVQIRNVKDHLRLPARRSLCRDCHRVSSLSGGNIVKLSSLY